MPVTQFLDLPNPAAHKATAAELNAAFAACASVADVFALRAYGFVGDGVADDAPALNALLAATSPANLRILLPPGTIRLGSTITTPGSRSIRVVGAGSQMTTLVWSPGVALGWNHGPTPGTGTFGIAGVRLFCSTTHVATALRVSCAAASNPVEPGFTADDVRIGDVGSPFWRMGIELYGCWNSRINDTLIYLDGYRLDTQAVGVRYAQAETATTVFPDKVTTVLTCNGLFVQGGAVGLSLHGNVQGVNLINGNLSGCGYGIAWNGAPGAGTLQVTNSQLATAYRGVSATDADNVMVSGCLFIQFDQFVANNWCAIELQDSQFPLISDNFFLNPGGNVPSALPVVWCHSTMPQSHGPGRVSGNLMLTQNRVPVELGGTVIGISVEDNDFWNLSPASPAAGLVAQTPAPSWAPKTFYGPNSAVVSGNVTFATVAGGTSAAAGSGPTGTALSDGSVQWTVVGPSLALAPNHAQNRFYGRGALTTGSDGRLYIGTPDYPNTIQGYSSFNTGIDIGSPGNVGYVDLHSSTTAGNDFDARLAVSGGTNGVLGGGDVAIYGTSLTVDCPIFGPFGLDLGGSVTPGFIDMHSSTVSPRNAYDARLVTNGAVAGANATGALEVFAGELLTHCPAVFDHGIEVGSTGNPGFVDLHSADFAGNNDFDARLIVDGGQLGQTGNGSLRLQAGAVSLQANYLGFYGTQPIPKPTLVGPKGGNTVLTSICIVLAALGLAIDNTTP